MSTEHGPTHGRGACETWWPSPGYRRLYGTRRRSGRYAPWPGESKYLHFPHSFAIECRSRTRATASARKRPSSSETSVLESSRKHHSIEVSASYTNHRGRGSGGPDPEGHCRKGRKTPACPCRQKSYYLKNDNDRHWRCTSTRSKDRWSKGRYY